MKRKQAVRRCRGALKVVHALRRWLERPRDEMPDIPQDAAGTVAVTLFWLLFVITIFASTHSDIAG